ncbi:MAG: AsmA family protein, partial [Chitinivibrionales bacterium]|nr:AsmA family protein [Chitinivibrionales bacterium]
MRAGTRRSKPTSVSWHRHRRTHSVEPEARGDHHGSLALRLQHHASSCACPRPCRNARRSNSVHVDFPVRGSEIAPGLHWRHLRPGTTFVDSHPQPARIRAQSGLPHHPPDTATMTKRKVAVIAGGVLAALLVLYLALFLVVRFYFTPERIQRMVVQPVEDALGREVTVEDAGVSIFPAIGLYIDDAAVANAQGPGFGDEPMITFERLNLRLDLLELLTGDAVITRTVLREPHIRIETTAAGSTNVQGLGAARDNGG